MHGTLVLEVKLDEDSLETLIDEIDDKFVPGLREDSIIKVFVGTEIALYCDRKEHKD